MVRIICINFLVILGTSTTYTHYNTTLHFLPNPGPDNITLSHTTANGTAGVVFIGANIVSCNATFSAVREGPLGVFLPPPLVPLLPLRLPPVVFGVPVFGVPIPVDCLTGINPDMTELPPSIPVVIMMIIII